MQLPADDYPADIAARVLAEGAEQAEEFSRHGYDFVLIGDRDGLAEALASAGLAVPDQIVPAGAGELLEFLNARPARPSAPGPGSTAERPKGGRRALELPWNEVQAGGVGLGPPERPGPLRGLDVSLARRGHVEELAG